MEKKLLFVLFLFCFLPSFYLADSINHYVVSSPVPLGKNLTVYGKYDANSFVDIYCAFYIFDIENIDTNAAVLRLNDVQTFSDGSFFAEYQITEPLFRRGIDYNAVTVCGTAEIGKVFSVSQKEDIIAGKTSESFLSDLRFFVSPENSLIAAAVLVCVVCVVLGGAWLWSRRNT